MMLDMMSRKTFPMLKVLKSSGVPKNLQEYLYRYHRCNLDLDLDIEVYVYHYLIQRFEFYHK